MDYKKIENTFKNENDYTVMTILNKKGKEFEVKVDTDSVDKIKAEGTWFAEWNKDSNSYLVVNIHSSKTNKKGKSLKQNLGNIVLNEDINAPIIHKNGDTLDNRAANLEVFNRNAMNETETVDNNTVAIILKDKSGNKIAKTLISKEDLNDVVTDFYTWTLYKTNRETTVVANTPEGRLKLDVLLMNPTSKQYVHHINLNPLDNRKANLELKEIIE
ncbi:MAG: hypothetical protein ACRDAU_10100 [Clostridium sp.]